MSLHVFATSLKRQNNVRRSNAITDVILQWQLTSASVRFPHAFKYMTLLFHITCFFSIGYIGDVCLNPGHNKKPPARLEPGTSDLKSSTLPRSQCTPHFTTVFCEKFYLCHVV